MSTPAYLITFTTYGTWLHGDARGSHARPGSFVAPSPARLAHAAARRVQAPVTLSVAGRAVVHATILEVCRHRGYTALAVNVRTEHLHAVIAGEATPEHIANSLKSWSTRRLREAGLVAADRRVWTEGASTRWLNGEANIAAAMHYVLHEQGGGSAAVPDGPGLSDASAMARGRP